MSNQEYFEKMKFIQSTIEQFLDNEGNIEENKEILTQNIISEQIIKDRIILKSILYLISKITKNHHRKLGFLPKIKKILTDLKSAIKENFTNLVIFNIFKKQKIILLFLLEQEMITFDSSIFEIIKQGKYVNYKYLEYFHPEIKQFISKEDEKNDNIADFEEKRKKGENDGQICYLIREDMIEEFIIYVNKKNLPL